MISELLKEHLRQIIRVGVVCARDAGRCACRVEFADADADGKPLISDLLPVVVRKTLKDKDFWLPDVGEHVLCLFLPHAMEQGFILGAFYSEADEVPEDAGPDRRVEMLDGGVGMIMDREAGELIFKATSLRIDAATATSSGNFSVGGNLDTGGTVHAGGDITTDGTNPNKHSH